MNRRGTEPYARWCERPEGATPPAYSINVSQRGTQRVPTWCPGEHDLVGLCVLA